MRIGELARTADTPVRTVRYYEEIGLLPPAERSASGYRVFTEHHLQCLRFIRAARSLGLKLAQIHEILDVASETSSPCPCVRGVVQRNIHEIDQRMDALRSMRDALERTLTKVDIRDRRGGVESTSICPAIESMASPGEPMTLDSPVDWRV